jgi:hypothetical protein
MTISLKLLFEGIHKQRMKTACDRNLHHKLGSTLLPSDLGYFLRPAFSGSKASNRSKLALSLEHNPVARYIAERHTPVHEGLVTTPKAWKLICPRPDHWHVMAGPIVNRGQVVGSVGCTREKSMPALILKI